MTRQVAIVAAAATLLATQACIRPQNYHAGAPPVTLRFPESGNDNGYYFHAATVHEAYVEFDAQGHLFEPAQVNRAVDEMKRLQQGLNGTHRDIFVTVFIHGWKNNASEDSGNVWGFRRMLDQIAYRVHKKEEHMPVMGVYLGWPGDVTKVGRNLSFWNREQVAQTVGAGDLEDTLKQLLQGAKGEKYQGHSVAIVVGHSFGGLIMEKAMILMLSEYADALETDRTLSPPADLTLLLNEAGSASQARSFLTKLIERHDALQERLKGHPLIVSMTSDGDIATKLAFPGGEYISPSRPQTVPINPPDAFGQTTSLSYNLLTAANMVSLRSHQIVQTESGGKCDGIPIPTIHKKNYCMERLAETRNTTAYWIMALPQVFVPDHGQIFRNEVLAVISALLVNEHLMPAAVPSNGTATN